MKNFAKMVGIIALAAVIGFSMAACGDGNGGGGGGGDGADPALNGTWVDSEGGKIVLNNGAITVSNDNVEIMKGTYSTSGSNMTVTFTQVTGAIFGGEEGGAEWGLSTSQWYTEQQVKAAIVQTLLAEEEMSQAEAEEMYDEMFEDFSPFGSTTGAYTLSGNTLTVILGGEGAQTYTKQ